MTDHSTHDRGPSKEVLAAGHETAEVPARPVVTFLLGLSGAILVVLLLMTLLFRFFIARERRSSPHLTTLEQASQGRQPPEPRLQISPLRDYQEFMAAQDSILSTYRWVNRDSSIVRLPIERAIRLTAERALPARAGRTVPVDLHLRPPDMKTEPAREAGRLRLREPVPPTEPVPVKGGGHK